MLSQARTKELILEKIKLEFESERKLAHLKPRSREEAQGIANMARQQVLDQIYLKHDVRYADLNRAMKEYDFDGDEDIKALFSVYEATR